MIKVVAVFDGLKFSEATLHHSIKLVKSQGAHLVGLFLEDFTYQSFSKYRAIAKDKMSDKEIAVLENKDADLRRASRQLFEDVCKREGVEYSLHKEDNVAYPSLIHESIYADLVIIDQAETFTPYAEEKPTQFVKDFLAATECPVLLVRDSEDINAATLLFDGSPNSVFAIKQFSYVLKSAGNMPVEVITVKEPDESLHLPDNKLMKQFMKRHFPPPFG
ncbi:MAG: universal stress protein, partial [Chitinophagaceae bacterium]